MSKNTKKVTVGFGLVLLLALVVFVAVVMWPAEDYSSASQQVVGTFDKTLIPDQENSFVGQMYLRSGVGGLEDIRPAGIVSRSTGLFTLIPETVGWGFSSYLGTNSPVVSPAGNYLAYKDASSRAVVVVDTRGNHIYLPSDSIVGKETDVDTGIHCWSPDETKLLFTVENVPTGCGGPGVEGEACPVPKGIPEDVRKGYHVADFESGQVIFLAGMIGSRSYSNYEFKGWLSNHRLLFIRNETLFEYDLRNARLTHSLTFKDLDLTKLTFFSYVGSGANEIQLYTYGTDPNYSSGSRRLAARRDSSETILAEYGWGDLDYARLSGDGRYVIWKIEDQEEEHIFDLETL